MVPNVLYAKTSVPIANPKFVLAADAVVPPVPPFATATVPETFVTVCEPIFPESIIVFQACEVLIAVA